jgi:uncharacterized membrane protein YdbT with pleckstrin-like domain
MGRYVASNLIRGEQVVYETRRHWIIFLSLRGLLTLWFLPLIDYWTSEFAITNKRVIVKVGLISRQTLELNLQRVESVSVDQSILGRLLGYGTITIIGTGGTREPFHRIANPLEFRKAVEEQLSLLPVYRS